MEGSAPLDGAGVAAPQSEPALAAAAPGSSAGAPAAPGPAANAGQPAADQQPAPKYRGVRMRDDRFVGTLSARLDAAGQPCASGVSSGQHLLVCTTAAEAAVAADLGKLWRDTHVTTARDGQRFNFPTDRYYNAPGLLPALVRANNLAALQLLLKALAANSTLRALAEAPEAQAQQPAQQAQQQQQQAQQAQAVGDEAQPGSPPSGSNQPAAKYRYIRKHGRGFQVMIGMRLDAAGRVDERMGSRTHYVVGSHSVERAAVAADLTVLWRRAQQPGAAQREVLNFSADRYQSRPELLGRVCSCATLPALQTVLQELKRDGTLDRLAAQQAQQSAAQQAQQGEGNQGSLLALATAAGNAQAAQPEPEQPAGPVSAVAGEAAQGARESSGSSPTEGGGAKGGPPQPVAAAGPGAAGVPLGRRALTLPTAIKKPGGLLGKRAATDGARAAEGPSSPAPPLARRRLGSVRDPWRAPLGGLVQQQQQREQQPQQAPPLRLMP